MNDKERTIMDCVNRAQLAINDWQCSGEIYYLEQAKAELAEAVLLADELAKEKPVFLQYSAVPSQSPRFHCSEKPIDPYGLEAV